MARLKPLNPATCTECGSKTTRRIGYSKSRSASLWHCGECGKVFEVVTLVLSRHKRSQPTP